MRSYIASSLLPVLLGASFVRCQTCPGRKANICKSTPGCEWAGGNGCVPSGGGTSPTTSPPVTSAPVTPAPIPPPAPGGLGYCDDGSGETCSYAVDCSCNDLRRRKLIRSGNNDNTASQSSSSHHRNLQCDYSKAKACRDNGCEWLGGGNCSPPPEPCACIGASVPTYSPNTFSATYVPGDFNDALRCDDGRLLLSKGLECRLVASAGNPVQFTDGSAQSSSENMHGDADGAAVLEDFSGTNDGGWYYVSNSEIGSGGGGVGSIRFNSAGEVIGYQMDLKDTSDNCGGGRTYWNTWVTCEEDGSNGFCHEVDPANGHTSQLVNVQFGGNYESFAYDDQDPDVTARFFTTEDSSSGALVRYTPLASAYTTGSNYTILTQTGGTYEYLKLNQQAGTFEWTSSLSEGESSASSVFPNAEGIDVHNRILNFVSKTTQKLITLDLASGAYTTSSTDSGALDLQPDQLGRILGDSDLLYFCEDGGSNCDIHARNNDGDYFTIVKGDGHASETTGLSFSPDGMHMYFAVQSGSFIYDVWRTDGKAFNGEVAYTKYHSAP